MKLPIDLSAAKHKLVTVPAIWLFIIFAAGWLGKPWIVTNLGLMDAGAAEKRIGGIEQSVDDLSQKVDTISLEIRMMNAIQMVSRAELELSSHSAQEVQDLDWRIKDDKLKSRLNIAEQYKECVLKEEVNCHLLQKQLWQ